jgi:hypothetical protein
MHISGKKVQIAEFCLCASFKHARNSHVSRLIWQLERVTVRINFHVHARKRKQRNYKLHNDIYVLALTKKHSTMKSIHNNPFFASTFLCSKFLHQKESKQIIYLFPKAAAPTAYRNNMTTTC